jgi:ferric-dicitrate binding protein FerR (iron transport regulator)
LITEETIKKFFEGKCDGREAAIVQAWLRENPARLTEYLGQEEWEDFQPAQVLSPAISGKLWNGINKTRSPHLSYRRWTAAAASVLLVIGLAWLFTKQKTMGAATVAKTKQVFNSTAQKMTLTLSDGSTVELLPNSTLSYPENFTSSKREVTVSGEANFDIAKDAARPFSVYSHSISITVLGTRFTVSAYEANTAAKVILHEGRVMVKVSRKEYDLAPGDIFLLKQANAPSRILHLEKDKEERYVFDNYPLDVVFDQLQIIYNTKIIYNKAELGNRTFIGKIDKRDSLYHILNSIALLNRFGFRKQGDSFIISK